MANPPARHADHPLAAEHITCPWSHNRARWPAWSSPRLRPPA